MSDLDIEKQIEEVSDELNSIISKIFSLNNNYRVSLNLYDVKNALSIQKQIEKLVYSRDYIELYLAKLITKKAQIKLTKKLEKEAQKEAQKEANSVQKWLKKK